MKLVNQVKVEVAITMIAIHLCQLAMNVGPKGCQLLPVEPADTAMCFIAGSACKSNWIGNTVAAEAPRWQWPLPSAALWKMQNQVGGQSHLCNPIFARVLLLPELYFSAVAKLGHQ